MQDENDRVILAYVAMRAANLALQYKETIAAVSPFPDNDEVLTAKVCSAWFLFTIKCPWKISLFALWHICIMSAMPVIYGKNIAFLSFCLQICICPTVLIIFEYTDSRECTVSDGNNVACHLQADNIAKTMLEEFGIMVKEFQSVSGVDEKRKELNNHIQETHSRFLKKNTALMAAFCYDPLQEAYRELRMQVCTSLFLLQSVSIFPDGPLSCLIPPLCDGICLCRP